MNSQKLEKIFSKWSRRLGILLLIEWILLIKDNPIAKTMLPLDISASLLMACLIIFFYKEITNFVDKKVERTVKKLRKKEEIK